jgi:hypothetical protein
MHRQTIDLKASKLYETLSKHGGQISELADKGRQHFMNDPGQPGGNLAHILSMAYFCILLEPDLRSACQRLSDERHATITIADGNIRDMIAQLPYMGEEYDAFFAAKNLLALQSQYYPDQPRRYYRDEHAAAKNEIVQSALPHIMREHQPLYDEALFFAVAGRRKSMKYKIGSGALESIAVHLVPDITIKSELMDQLRVKSRALGVWDEAWGVIKGIAQDRKISLEPLHFVPIRLAEKPSSRMSIPLKHDLQQGRRIHEAPSSRLETISRAQFSLATTEKPPAPAEDIASVDPEYARMEECLKSLVAQGEIGIRARDIWIYVHDGKAAIETEAKKKALREAAEEYAIGPNLAAIHYAQANKKIADALQGNSKPQAPSI